jgi:hypothetical protein
MVRLLTERTFEMITHPRWICVVLLIATSSSAQRVDAVPQHASQIFHNDPHIQKIDFQSEFYGYNSAVNRPTVNGEPAYNYCPDVMYDRGLNQYRLYWGGRWYKPGTSATAGVAADGDHVFQVTSPTGVGGSWSAPPAQPLWLNGWDFNAASPPGKLPTTWWHNNTLEPETAKINGKYYMYCETEIDPGQPLDIAGLTADGVICDRIMLFTSPDGNNWTRKSDRGVVTNVTDPTHTMLHHEEFIYAPWDAATPYHLFVPTFVGGPTGQATTWLLKSNDPTTYDWMNRVPVTGITPVIGEGNKIAYCAEAPGGPLLIRITWIGDSTGRQVPTLMFSRNETDWTYGDGDPIHLAGSTDNLGNQSNWFMAMSTLDGTGQLEYLGDNTYRLFYITTTCNVPADTDDPGDIYSSQLGVGQLTFTITPVPEPSVWALLGCGAVAGCIGWLHVRRRSITRIVCNRIGGMLKLSAFVRMSVVIAMLSVLVGCGRSNGPNRYELSGSVTYQNKPVPAGMIVFAPDVSIGNVGPAATATINKGIYHTRAGQGTIGGPHVATISGSDTDLDTIRKAKGTLKPKTLFSNIQMAVDLPKESSKYDFAIPAGK